MYKMSEHSDEIAQLEQSEIVNEYIENAGYNVPEIYKNNFDDEAYAAQMNKEDSTRGTTGRKWCFTWNNYPINHAVILENIKRVKYMVYGYEIGPRLGTPHLQGFIIFESDQCYGKRKMEGYNKFALKGRFPDICWSKMYETSSAECCIVYCKKDGNFTERGDPPCGQGNTAGAKSGFNELSAKIITRDITLEDCDLLYPSLMIRYSRGIRELIGRMSDIRELHPFVCWLYGGAGGGKSELAKRFKGEHDVYRKIDGTKFWNDYENETCVVLEEFNLYHPKDGRNNPKDWDFAYFLQIIDKYNISVEVKCSSVKMNSPYIFITSPHHPIVHFPDADMFRQVLRRINMIYKVPTDGSEPIEDEAYNDYYYTLEKDIPRTWMPKKLIEYEKWLQVQGIIHIGRTKRQRVIEKEAVPEAKLAPPPSPATTTLSDELPSVRRIVDVKTRLIAEAGACQQEYERIMAEKHKYFPTGWTG